MSGYQRLIAEDVFQKAKSLSYMEFNMLKNYTLEYWIEDEWYIGKLKEIPGVFSQGETLEDLETNIKDALHLFIQDDNDYWMDKKITQKEIEVEV